MQAKNSVFHERINKSSKIWRFLDFTEFVDLLDKNALFFTRADKLGDPLEGLFPKLSRQLNPEADNYNAKIKDKKNLLRTRQHTLLNSWHMNEYESAAMWQLYSHTSRGIAIQSTFKRLSESVKNHTEDEIHFAKVKYIDYNRKKPPKGNILYPLIYKRKSFEYENELRALIYMDPSKKKNAGNNHQYIVNGGKYVSVVMDLLIENIVTSPTAPEWFNDLVKSVAQKYGISRKAILISELKERPFY